jgi:hypothetical protein
LQVTPQPPQFAVVRIEVSQPLFRFPSQLAYPALQIGLQRPPAHEFVPAGFVHWMPQPPQFHWSFSTSRHEPVQQ